MTINQDYTFTYETMGDMTYPIATHKKSGVIYTKGTLQAYVFLSCQSMLVDQHLGEREKFVSSVGDYKKYSRLLRRLKKMEKNDDL